MACAACAVLPARKALNDGRQMGACARQPMLGRPPLRVRRPASKAGAARCVAFLEVPTTDGRTVLHDSLEDIRPAPMHLNQTVLLEAFGWASWRGNCWWRQLRAQVPDLAHLGVTHVWLPPPSASVSAEGYLPGQLFDLNSKYGSADELRGLCADLLKAGIRPVADIVINHRCADEQDETGAWTVYRDKVPHPGKSLAWGRWAIASNDPQFRGAGAPDSGEDYGPAPDLDHTNTDVRDSLVDWLNWLHLDIGFEGWRFDFVRGYAPKYCQEYIERTGFAGEHFCVGELFLDLRWNNSFLDYNQDGARERYKHWMREAKDCAVFDFVLKGQLQEAAKNQQYDRLRDGAGCSSGLIGWMPERCVTFVDNHDTGSTQQHWPFPGAFVPLGYAYILTHPGMPCILHEHLADGALRKLITDLVALRQRAGLRADSRLEILAADRDMYVACIGGKVTLKLGPRYDMGGLVPRKEEGWELAAWGKFFAVWEKK